MQTHILGYSHSQDHASLKEAYEKYLNAQLTISELIVQGNVIKQKNWQELQQMGVDLIPSNDFSFYDRVLDMAFTVDAIPERYHDVILKDGKTELDLYFAMAEGYESENIAVNGMDKRQWFDSNYSYVVPEFTKGQQFRLFGTKVINDYCEAKRLGVKTKPVLLGPVSFLLLGKQIGQAFNVLDLLDHLIPVYCEVLKKLEALDVEWVQFDEPCLASAINDETKRAFTATYSKIKRQFPHLKTMVATYFHGLEENVQVATNLPVSALHLDLINASEQLMPVLQMAPACLTLSLGVINVDSNSVIVNERLLKNIEEIVEKRGDEKLMLSANCALGEMLGGFNNTESLIRLSEGSISDRVKELMQLKQTLEGHLVAY